MGTLARRRILVLQKAQQISVFVTTRPDKEMGSKKAEIRVRKACVAVPSTCLLPSSSSDYIIEYIAGPGD